MPHSAAADEAPGLSGELISALRDAMSRVNHEINNPLAIISGNAQLLLALGTDLDPDLLEPIQDIEEASHRLSTSLRKLVELRNLLENPEVASEEVIEELRQLGAS